MDIKIEINDFNYSVTGAEVAVKQYLHKKIKTAWRSAIKAFINSVYEDIEPFIDTGMSAGSLIPVAKAVNMKGILVESLRGRALGTGHGLYKANGPFAGGPVEKSISAGEELGERPRGFEIEYGTPDNPQFIFDFNIRVLQFYLHNYGLAQPFTYHWDVFPKAEEAFKEKWESEVDRLFTRNMINNLIRKGRADG